MSAGIACHRVSGRSRGDDALLALTTGGFSQQDIPLHCAGIIWNSL